MEHLDNLRKSLVPAARDTKINLQSVFKTTSLNDNQQWLVALSCAFTLKNAALTEATLKDAAAVVGDDVLDDAKAVASLMAMNNVFYRFRHMVGKETYSTMPARLRMNRLAKPATNKADFELASLAASAIGGCEMCIRSHEEVVLEAGLSEEQVFDAVRIAAGFSAAATSLTLPG